MAYWDIKAPAQRHNGVIIKKQEQDFYICKENELVKETKLTCDVLHATLGTHCINLLLQMPDGKTFIAGYGSNIPSNDLVFLEESAEKSYANVHVKLYCTEQKYDNLKEEYYDDERDKYWNPIEIKRYYSSRIDVEKLYIKKSELK